MVMIDAFGARQDRTGAPRYHTPTGDPPDDVDCSSRLDALCQASLLAILHTPPGCHTPPHSLLAI